MTIFLISNSLFHEPNCLSWIYNFAGVDVSQYRSVKNSSISPQNTNSEYGRKNIFLTLRWLVFVLRYKLCKHYQDNKVRFQRCCGLRLNLSDIVVCWHFLQTLEVPKHPRFALKGERYRYMRFWMCDTVHEFPSTSDIQNRSNKYFEAGSWHVNSC